MAKTLADMTAEERGNCVGMWCDVKGFTRPTPIVEMWGMEVELLISDNLRGHITETYEFEQVTPRFDLPRAWTPDGEPVGVVVDAEVEPLRVNGMVNHYATQAYIHE